MILVKLGGSVITDKGRLRSFRSSATERLARELRRSPFPLTVVHGAGSFGHIEARRHGLHLGLRSDSQLRHVASVQRDVRELNLKVLEALIDSGIRAVSVPPAASASFKDGAIRSFSKEAFGRMLAINLTPVTFGDVVPDSSMGFSICSGDLMMMALAKAFRPRLAVFCADVDGVFDRDPKRSRGAKLIPVLDRKALRGLSRTAARNADVTGSMYGKLERMLAIAEHCEKCMIVNGNVPGRLGRALSGRQVLSTVVIPE
ncbi:MAG: isopentenyl phosphate kinase family protein [Candidatus Thermoplasmatota archaeon]|nr:isopentenyl phosphate kinase family protein [Candidatus Thermoplasmatota archaeon]